MKLEELVRTVVSGAVDDYLNSGGELSASFKVPAEASGRHVHLSPEDVERLFGAGYELTPKRPLSQPGQYLAEERVTLIGPNATFKNVAILGPPRSHTQVEVSATDARTLGLDPPVALSGDLSQAADMLIASKDAFLMAEQSLIIAQNHLHLSEEEAAAAGLRNGDRVDVRMCTDRPLTFHDVVVRSGPGHKMALHIDFDEANACGFVKGCEAIVLKRGESAPTEEWEAPTTVPAPAAVQTATEVQTELGSPTTVGDGDVMLSTGFLTEVQVRDAIAAGATAVVVQQKTVVSPLAKDLLHKHGISLKRL